MANFFRKCVAASWMNVHMYVGMRLIYRKKNYWDMIFHFKSRELLLRKNIITVKFIKFTNGLMCDMYEYACSMYGIPTRPASTFLIWLFFVSWMLKCWVWLGFVVLFCIIYLAYLSFSYIQSVCICIYVCTHKHTHARTRQLRWMQEE